MAEDNSWIVPKEHYGAFGIRRVESELDGAMQRMEELYPGILSRPMKDPGFHTWDQFVEWLRKHLPS